MTTTTQDTTTTADAAVQPTHELQEKIRQVRALYADGPELGKKAIENMIDRLNAGATVKPPRTRMESAGRIGYREGNVAELTVLAPIAPGGAERLRGLLQLLNGNFDTTDLVGTVHDMRFVFLDNDTKVLFATAYDGDWDAYIEDFATKIPDAMDLIFSNFEGWPGIHSPKVKDVIAGYQVPAAAWYVANPNQTVVETRRLQRVSQAVDKFLDDIDQIG